jgi:hypothetical protein
MEGDDVPMRSQVAVALIVTLVALSFVGPAFARHPTISGQVIAVDSSAKTLTIKAEFGPMTFTVEKRAGRAWVNLKPGDKVTVMTHSFTSVGPLDGELDWMPSAQTVTKD